MNWKKYGYNFIYHHVAVIICLLPISVAFLTLSLIYLTPQSIIAIVSYLLAFYVLLVIGFRMPKFVSFFKVIKNENKYVKRFLDDVHLRINITLYGSLIVNVVFAIFQLWLGFYYGSIWFYSMFAYYILLGGMRFFLVNHTMGYGVNQNMKRENTRYVLCGWLLLIMNLALAVIIFSIVYWGRTFEHHMITTIALATYTFFSLTLAIINIFRFKKYNSPVYSASKNINLIAASVSMLTLETTMLTTFGTAESELFAKIILPLTGVVVIGFAITVSIIMIVRGLKNLKSIRVQE